MTIQSSKQEPGSVSKATLSLCLLAVCVALTAQDASAQGVIDAAEKWGLFGTWAVDCAKPPSRENPYLSFSREVRGVLHGRDFGDVHDSHPVLAGKINSDGMLEIVVELDGYAQRRTVAFLKGRDGRKRAMLNRDDKGNYSIRNGKFVANGQPTPWQARCATLTQ